MIVARWFLLISGPRVRVPGGALQQQNPNFFPIGEGVGFFVFLCRLDFEWRSGEILEKRNREPWIRGLKVKKQGAPLNEQHPICPTVFGLTNGAFLYVRKTKDVQRRMRPIFIVQDALHDSPVG